VTVGFAMPVSGPVSIGIYDIRGALVRRLAGGDMRATSGMLRWRGIDDRGIPVSPGIYFVRVAAPGQEKVLKVVIVD
jgi:flagellar hook assembly protein FlgD